ncbi:uncharacterized protein [Hetaerina americana]|uniref:uncharacterized protein isoform X2 n=1 Tax=Hetaerina americana TaxID=62018 RepID=UPI003A7F262F
MAGVKTCCVCLLFLPLLCTAIRFYGEDEVTKPPQRQEFLLWNPGGQQQQEEWPAETVRRPGARFEKGARPTVATRAYWITPTATHPPDSPPPPPPPTIAPLGGSRWRWPPPTVAPLPPNMRSDLQTTRASPYDHQISPPQPQTRAPSPSRDHRKGGGAVDEGMRVAEREETTVRCTGRGHSWGCGPFGPRQGREDEGPPADVGTRLAEGEAELVGDGVLEGAGTRSSLAYAGGGWIAPKDWCLLPMGQFPYPLDCRRFVNCWNGRGFIQPCAPGTLFNADTLECDFPSKVKNCQTWGRTPSRGQPQQGPGVSEDLVGAASSSGKLVMGEESDDYVGEDYGEGALDIRVSNRARDGGGHQTTTPRVIAIPPRAITTVPRVITTTTRAIPTTRRRQAKVFQSQMSCPEANGIFPHPEFCDRFVNCHAGRPHSMMCGPGTFFDARNKRCDYARNVQCSIASPQEEWGEEEELTPEESRHHAIVDSPPASHDPWGSRAPTTTAPTPATTTTPAPTTTTVPVSTTTAPPRKGTTRALSGGGAQWRPAVTSRPRPPPGGWPTPITPEEVEEGPGTPPTGQSVRLRGGQWPWEGHVEVHVGGGQWSPVCDHGGRWTLAEGNVVCRQLGYHRGAEITWQGHWSEVNTSGQVVHVWKVECRGDEVSLATCRLEGAGTCNLKKDAVAVRCLGEYRSLCGVDEVPFGGHCYSLAPLGSPGGVGGTTSREVAAKECERKGGHLVRIVSQEENDFLSEWLLHRHPEVLTLMTGGVGVPMGSKNVWMWESSQFAMTYSNWWNGWRSGEGNSGPNSGRCVIMSRMFKCPHGQGQHAARPPLAAAHFTTQGQKHCKTDYHFWSTHDCNIPTHGAICKRNPDDIGCVWNLGMDYAGQASVTRHGNSCIPWDSGPFGSPHPDNRLQRHNLCRNYGGADGGGAAEGHPWCYVNSRGGWESCEIPPCRATDQERPPGSARGGPVEKPLCRADEFNCGDECIPRTYICDGLKDCPNGKDEEFEECKGGGLLKEFRRKGGTKHKKAPLEKWVQVSAKDCANYCLEKEKHPHSCTGFSYHLKDQQCLLVAGNKSGGYLSQPEFERTLGWDHYELLPPTVNCRGMFHCKNGTCIDSNKVCNGFNDCGDRSDEVNCSSDAVGFSLRLVGGNVSHEGRIEVKAFGRWGVVCDDLFGLADADVVCKELGFTLGAAEAVLHSGFGSGVIKGPPLFLMDDVECIGTESSLSECRFPGWGDHNCGPEEVAGVVCKIAGSVCQDDQFHCHHSKECIPIEYLCDNLKDCEDGSDEDPVQCQSEVMVRLAGGPSNLAGRVEVRYNGVWGTVCDDDFGVQDAQVICRSLGLGWGSGVLALKEAHYGPGKGPIWLDELHCSGQEEKIIDCPRFPWGKNNCGHKEDASVKCTPPGDEGNIITAARSTLSPWRTMKESRPSPMSASDILPSGCSLQVNTSEWLRAFGVVQGNGHHLSNSLEAQPRVTGGKEFQMGPIPWQASLRVRTGPGKSVHWCGAVVLSPLLALTAGHCIQDYSKEAYVLRVGDFDAKLDEGTEQEVAIEEVYLHEDFNKGAYLNNDIALLKLKAPPGIRFGDQVHGVCLPSAEDVGGSDWGASTTRKCVISGWGSVGNSAGFSRTLRSAVIQLLSQSVCRAAHVYGEQAIGDGMGCAGSLNEGGADACQGDSGGPLVCFDEDNKPTLQGITSWGQGCGRANKPGVYSRISFYRKWIDQKIQAAIAGM